MEENKIMETNEEVEVINLLPAEDIECEAEGKNNTGKLIALGIAAIGGAALYLGATKKKRAEKRLNKQIAKLEAQGYVIGKEVKEEAEPVESTTEDVIPEESEQ